MGVLAKTLLLSLVAMASFYLDSLLDSLSPVDLDVFAHEARSSVSDDKITSSRWFLLGLAASGFTFLSSSVIVLSSWVESTVAAIQQWLRARQLAVESCIARATAQARNILRRRKPGTTAATNEELETGEEPQAIAGGLVAVEMDQAATAQSQAEVIPASPSQSQRALALLTSFLSLANAISMCQKWTQDGHDLALIATAICAASAFCFLHSFLVGLGHIEKQRRKGCMTILLTALIAFFYPLMGIACRRLKGKKGWATAAVYTVSAVVPFVTRVICLLPFTHEVSTVIASACSLLSGVAWLIFSSIVEYQILHIVGACLAVAVQVIYFVSFVSKCYGGLCALC